MNIKAINLALIRRISQFQEDEIELMTGKHLLNSMDALPSGFDVFDVSDDPVGVKSKKYKLFRDAKKGQVVVIGKKKWKIDRNLGVRDSLPRGRGKGGRYLHFVATDHSSSFPGDTLFFYLDVSKDKIRAFKAGSRGGYSRVKVEGIESEMVCQQGLLEGKKSEGLSDNYRFSQNLRSFYIYSSNIKDAIKKNNIVLAEEAITEAYYSAKDLAIRLEGIVEEMSPSKEREIVLYRLRKFMSRNNI